MTGAAPSVSVRDAVLVHDKLALSGDKAAQDVAVQMDAIEAALRELGVRSMRLPVDIDLRGFKNRLMALRPGVVFNLAESLDRSDRLQTIVPLLLEEWRVPFTGSGALAMHLANHKIAAKVALIAGGLPTPACAWLDAGGTLRFLPEAEADAVAAGSWIIKTRDSHASLFLDDSSVVSGLDGGALSALLREKEARHGQPFFAERFIAGREFNLSVLEDREGGAVVLPAGEITFADLPAGKPHIVGYGAKWDEESTEYIATPRVFPGGADRPLLDRLSALSLSAWKLFGLAGYARVDFRVDASGQPFILEANANPALSPDAGFAAAAAQGGLSYKDLVARIVGAAARRG